MQKELLEKLSVITPEEQAILDGAGNIDPANYTSFIADQSSFTVDSGKLLKKGQLIELRPHTRFVHFPRHHHNYVELVYMCRGTTTHIINDTDKVVLNEGDLLFLNQNATQEILPAGAGDIAVNFILLPEFFDRPISMIEQENVLRDFFVQALSGDSTLYSYLHFSAKDILPVQNLLENMIWTLFTHTPNTHTIIQTTMGLMLMNLSLFTDKIHNTNPDQYEQSQIFAVLQYIDTHYRNGTLADISETIKQPTYYVSRLLKKHLNKNFKDLLVERKLQQASYLLSQSSLNTEQILEAIGYDNSSYFFRIFREKYGCSPSAYRKQSKVTPKDFGR